ncbi:T9SS type A sorting domain-containing protein [Marivirga sp. S37H4]|uniref:T9SS type A sorting domain-containing protein n=1 Tax=Marivirga aurantiaca TaxID=2802615 RepID=A0A934X2Q2_9BACT|nr:alpha-amylase family glycosyl hydrolase [Marivirga aurantiaca]MBK6267275.1 T9SS type A sorting domain-containing protein [Marivirga aurantiaca]
MLKFKLLLFFILTTRVVQAQTVITNPTIPQASEEVTFTVNSEGTSLEGYTGDVWIWTWLNENCTTGCDAPTNVNPATDAQSDALMTRSEANPDVYTITFVPVDFFNKPVEEITQIGLKLKSVDWADNKQTDTDLFVDFSDGSFDISLVNPSQSVLFVNSGEDIAIEVAGNRTADFQLFVNDLLIDSQIGISSYTYVLNVNQSSGSLPVRIEAIADGVTEVEEFTYIIRTETVNEPLPAGIKKGINYHTEMDKVTLALWAPNNQSAYLVSELSNWEVDLDYKMKRDGEIFWITLDNLTPGKEYPFQYLVDEQIYIAEPFADKVLDPDDQYIPESTYPDLIDYPEGARHTEWYFNRASVFQTNQEEYQWEVDDFEQPENGELVIYELLIRDYLGVDDRNYEGLIDTLNYIKSLGVNAIELMPVMEFNGNNSWGYNPAFMFAPDKFYGTKNNFKAFIDECHKNGIAVILDIAMNHQDAPSPFLLMDLNFNTFVPETDNKWFNQQAKHPFNVFFDMNHESIYTQELLDSINHYWLEEYKIDGYRFDLSKGFTQTNTGDNVGAWSGRDNSRIALLKRMADEIWSTHPDAYVILEHFADNSEETELANYGMMLWGNLHYAYSQLAMGYNDNANIDNAYHGTRGWNNPNLVSYMESHDEERLMYQLINNGNASGGYSTKNVNTALERMKAASALFYTIPGPKMLWQFGEFGYDVSINENGRTGEKPLLWNYLEDVNRERLLKTTSEIIKLRNTYEVFDTESVVFREDQKLFKEISLLSDPFISNPTNSSEMNVHVIANMDVVPKAFNTNFPHQGNWLHYFSGGDTLNVTSDVFSVFLQPGEFRIYTDVKLESPEAELINYSSPIAPELTDLSEIAEEGVSISWEDNSNIELSYSIYRKTDSEDFVEIDKVSADVTNFIDSEVLPNQQYTYRVSANNSYLSSVSNELVINTTSILSNDRGLSSDLNLYPNPSKDYLIIEFKQDQMIYDIKIFDSNGNSYSFDSEKISEGMKIITKYLPNNILFISFNINNTSYTKKIIVK